MRTLTVVLLPPDTNIVGSHWTHICKCNEDRTARAKSRVVAQGFTQTFGVDYDETYAPVSRLASLRSICAISARNDWPIHQMHVYNAYVNADLDEPIYMRQPQGYTQVSDQHVLKPAMYGLKQSGRAWYKCLSTAMDKIGFSKSKSDAKSKSDGAIFYRHAGKGFAIIAVAVDDLTITSKNDDIIQEIKADLMKIFKMKDLGKLH